jgi:hypothetical protein
MSFFFNLFGDLINAWIVEKETGKQHCPVLFLDEFYFILTGIRK